MLGDARYSNGNGVRMVSAAEACIGVHCELLKWRPEELQKHRRRLGALSYRIDDPAVGEHVGATIPASVKLVGAGKVTKKSDTDARDHFGGVYAATGEVLPESCTKRGPAGDAMCIIGPAAGHTPAPTEHIAGVGIYGGYLFRHFGHILTETVSRLWGARLKYGKAPIYMQSDGGKMPALAAELLDLAGLGGSIQIVKRDLSLDQVLVPEPAFVLRNRIHRVFKDLYLRMTDKALGSGPVYASEQPLYLSRTALRDDQRPIIGELDLEEQLLRSGVRVVHTEQLPLVDQIRCINAHRTVIAPIGSALHLLLFSRIAQDVFCYTKTPPNTSYLLCDALNGSQTRYLRTSEQGAVVEHPLLKHWEYPELLDVECTLSLLQDQGVIDRRPERPQRASIPPQQQYLRTYLSKALKDAARWRSLELASTVLDRIREHLPDDKALLNQAEATVTHVESKGRAEKRDTP